VSDANVRSIQETIWAPLETFDKHKGSTARFRPTPEAQLSALLWDRVCGSLAGAIWSADSKPNQSFRFQEYDLGQQKFGDRIIGIVRVLQTASGTKADMMTSMAGWTDREMLICAS
ncbi:MAG: hypothetical protein O7D32_05680, partial [bacterium]|nr:hypothetical protein [bacterium]